MSPTVDDKCVTPKQDTLSKSATKKIMERPVRVETPKSSVVSKVRNSDRDVNRKCPRKQLFM